MDVVTWIVALRGIERLLIVLAAIIATILGALLYKWGVFDKTEINAAKNGWAVLFKNSGPGLIFAILGLGCLAYAISSPAYAELHRRNSAASGGAEATTTIDDLVIGYCQKNLTGDFEAAAYDLLSNLATLDLVGKSDETIKSDLAAFKDQAKAVLEKKGNIR
jgi:hypothetical protein